MRALNLPSTLTFVDCKRDWFLFKWQITRSYLPVSCRIFLLGHKSILIEILETNKYLYDSHYSRYEHSRTSCKCVKVNQELFLAANGSPPILYKNVPFWKWTYVAMMYVQRCCMTFIWYIISHFHIKRLNTHFSAQADCPKALTTWLITSSSTFN